MAIAEFSGSDEFLDAVDASLTWDFSAVVVRGAIKHANQFYRPQSNKNITLTSCVLQDILPIEETTDRIAAWASAQGLHGRGFQNALSRIGGINPHIDPEAVTPFAISIALHKRARFRTQLLNDYRPDFSQPDRVYNYQQPVDSFIQASGDIVFIPGHPNPTIHGIQAPKGRIAKVFDATCSSVIPLNHEMLQHADPFGS